MLLSLLDDYSVGGTKVTPGVPSYANLRQRRRALKTVEDWTSFEAIHINAAGASLRNAYKDLGWRHDPPTEFQDRVVLMDFDIYDKEGNPKGAVITPDEVLHRLQSEGFPLPYCYTQSGTSGNFHMMWVFSSPQPRAGNMNLLKEVYSYWGADPAYTNSTMRNPIFSSVQPNHEVHWWSEWSDQPPTLDKVQDLYPRTTVPVIKVPEGVLQRGRSKSTTAPSSKGKFRNRLSDKQLVQLMQEAEDQDGRWYMLRSWVARHMRKAVLESGEALSNRQVAELVEEGNQLLKEPLELHRVRSIVSYWSPSQQWEYVIRQRRAGEANTHIRSRALSSREAAATRYFEVLDFRDKVATYLANNNFPPHLSTLNETYTGTRSDRKGVPCYAFIAWLLEISPREIIDKDTGEVTREIPPATQVRSILTNGKKAGYTRGDCKTEDSSGEEPLGGPDILDEVMRVANLTPLSQGPRLGVHEAHGPPQVRKKGILYAC